MNPGTLAKKVRRRRWRRRMVISFSSSENEKDKEKRSFRRTSSDPIPIPRPERGGPSSDTRSSGASTFLVLDGACSSTPPCDDHSHRAWPRVSLEQDAEEEEGVEPAVVTWEEENSVDQDDDDMVDVGCPASGLETLLDNERHALKNLSRSTPAMSPSASPRHSDSEGPPRVSKGTKKFMRHFSDAPSNEWVLNYFSCALVSDILLQGTLYITPNYFAFYSNIFGHVSRLLIPVSQVAGIQKERTAKIIPNAVGLQMLDGKTYAFGSLLSRDSTYKLMLHIWKKAQRMADSDSEPPSAVQVAGEDDGEDSVSGSAESLMEEDQTDSGYLASNPISTVAGVPTVSSSGPWTRDGPLTTTNTLSGILPSPDVCTSSTNTSSSIPLNSLANAPNCSVLQQGSSSTTRADALAEEPGGGGGTGTTAGAGGNGANYLEWFSEGSLVKTCFRMGSIPVKLVGEGVRELWSLPRTSLLLLISTLLLLMLFASAAFMLHRVDVLSQQLGLEKYDEYDSMYEEVLQMQQRLHAAASTEIEKTLSIQLKHIATVRQSLEALVVLFNKEPPMNTARIPDNT